MGTIIKALVLTVGMYVLLTGLMPKAFAQQITLKGKVTDSKGKPLPYATVSLTAEDIRTYTIIDGSFTLTVPPALYLSQTLTLRVSYVGKQTLTREVAMNTSGILPVFILKDDNLKLPDVEVNGIRKKTSASNSSILFDREAIEQTQALSLANVLDYLPGQTIMKPNVSVQGMQALTLRSAVSSNTVEALNNAFGISVVVDGGVVSNDANMQAMNPGRGLFSANNISNPENGVIKDRSWRNGTLYRSYENAMQANNGLDLRTIPAENIENIEVVSGVASARYGEYTTGLVVVNRQAGLTPLRVTVRTNEATRNIGINKGYALSPAIGVVNVSFDYLNSQDDPRDKLKGYQRIAGSVLWTYQPKGLFHFKNTLSLDGNATIDQTKQDPDLGTEQMAKFSNRSFTINNRSEWLVKKPWLYNIQLQGNYSWGRQESYEQRYLNSNTFLGIIDAMETGIHEGYFTPGYYLSVKHIIGEPVNAAARLETNSIFKLSKVGTYKLTVGVNYSYSANKGPGILIDPSRPRFHNSEKKNDRIRPYNDLPVLSNGGIYIENSLATKVLNRPLNLNLGFREDIQNKYYTLSPRLSASYKVSKQLNWNIAYGIATKAPALSQVSPGNVYIDIPLISAYNGSANQSLYLAYTKVIPLEDLDIKPYRSKTFETGMNLDAGPLQASLYYFNRTADNGFTTLYTVVPLELPNYTVMPVADGKPSYTPNGTYSYYLPGYNRMANGSYNRSDGLELMIGIKKIQAIQTSFNIGTAYYRSSVKTNVPQMYVPENPRYDLVPLYGLFNNTETKSANVKTTLVSTTHIPSLRMAIMLTGELFWLNRSELMPSSVYPIGYYTKQLEYFPLTPEQAQLPEYAHLTKKDANGNKVTTQPAFVYPNMHARLSKEIGDYLRFSFNAYNVFNIRPKEKLTSGTAYYNGQPAYGAELIFSIK
ncbi:TonB-dependent receptor domain-containing protein [Chitinophaga sp. 30R24]|uniref:TonB-dependent receptor n=1 Tax=Chitinophaga sp. 30R24 TaxID=3248838 RepID=UPI003B9159F9